MNDTICRHRGGYQTKLADTYIKNYIQLQQLTWREKETQVSHVEVSPSTDSYPDPDVVFLVHRFL